MKFKILFLILILLFLNFETVAAAENKYGSVRAWFNGENATVNGVQLKIGEPIELKLDVLSKVNGHVSLKLKEPGVTNAYDVLSGPSKIDEKISNLNIESGWSKTYAWSLAPNGAWKNGNAPINIIVQFHDLKTKNDEIIQFTIANPYILDEQYSGAVTTTTAAPKITETGAPPANETPFLSMMFAFAALLLAWWRMH